MNNKTTVIQVSNVPSPPKKKSEAVFNVKKQCFQKKRGKENVKYEIANFNDNGLRHTNI